MSCDRCALGDLERLGVDLVIFDLLGGDWLKGPEADMQSDLGAMDALLIEPAEDFRREVQSGSRSRHRSLLAREHGLVAFPVCLFV